MDKKGQVTIFIILAVLIVAGVIIYFAVRDKTSNAEDVPEEFRPVYRYYLSCIEDSTRQGINLLGEQGGYIETPEFEPGSAYMPFSSQLDFFGQPVPYWMYVSGNNLLKEQVPLKKDMEESLNKYVNERVVDCDFTDYELEGYDIFIGDEVVTDSSINNFDVELSVENTVTIFRGNSSIVIENHNLDIRSKLGKYYSLAREIYDVEKSDAFLEKYALDVMRLYSPVDGSEISCVPKIFVDEEIKQDLRYGLAENILTLKFKGSYYELSSKEREYFVVDSDLNIDENINFIYSPDWPTRIEIYGDRVVEPVGLQEGLGVLGFCYVPYHLVYDINFPVMIQFFDNENLFQFPVGVVISKNRAREALPTSYGVSIESDVCKYPNQEVKISTFDIDNNPVDSRITFKCLDSICNIGLTNAEGSNSVLNARMPSCVNGFVIASAEGFADSKYQVSTNAISSLDIIMNKKYNLSLDLGSIGEGRNATVSFYSKDYSTSVVYPGTKSIELVEGYYNVTVFVYDSSSLVLPGVNDRKCVDVPASGVAGLFGVENEKCYDISIPPVEIDFAVVGGGKSQNYVTVEELEGSRELNVNVPLFELPKSVQELQENSLRVEDEGVILSFE